MIKSEWKNLFKNKFLMIVVIGIMTIPTIYTTIFLGSMWDPYGKVDKLPVAIVNNDKSVVYEDKTMEIGKELVDNLKENNSLDFNFVDKDVAKSGLENGTYYMVVTIPEDFSENATTLMDETPKQMALEYEINPGTNYIASKMSQTAIIKMRNNIQEKITKQYAETIFDRISDLGDGLTEAADGTNDAVEGVNKLKDGNDKITSGAQELASKSLVFRDGANELHAGVTQYTDGVKTARDGSVTLQSGVNKYTDGVKTAKDGASQLQAGLLKYTNGVETAKDGSVTLNSGLLQYTNGVATAKSGAEILYSGVVQYTDGVQAVKDGSAQVVSGLGSLNEAAPMLSNGMNKISSSSGSLNDGIQKLSESNNKVVYALNTMSDSIGKVVDNGSEAQKEMNKLKYANSVLDEGIQSLNEQLQNADSSSVENSLQAIGSNAKAAGNAYQNTTNQIVSSNAFNSLSDVQKSEILKILQDNGADLNNNLTAIGNNTMKTANEFSSKMNDIKTGVSTIADNSKKVLPANTNVINELAGGLSNIKYSLDKQGQSSDDMGLIQAMKAIGKGTDELAVGIKKYTSAVDTVNKSTSDMSEGINKLFLGAGKVDSGLGQLTGKNADLNEGTAKLYAGLNQLVGNNQELNGGAGRLQAGLDQLTEKNPELNGGINRLGNGLGQLTAKNDELNSGVNRLTKGLDTLTSKNGDLLSGISKLSDGAEKISDGSGKLADGSETLGNGLNDLYDGTVKLNEGLTEGADKVNSMNTSDGTYEMMATPVETDESFMTNVDNNGNAMAPYMMCVGLWVGCIAFCIMYPLTSYTGKMENAFKWWLSKASILGVVTVLQAIIMVLMIKGVNGLNSARLPQTILIACVASLTFMAIMYFFNILLDKIGSFLMLVFMVLQLGGCAGTYPIELAAPIYAVIKPLMPFTYCVHAFRASICDGVSVTKDILVLLSILAVFVLMTIGVFYFKAGKVTNEEEELKNSLVNA